MRAMHGAPTEESPLPTSKEAAKAAPGATPTTQTPPAATGAGAAATGAATQASAEGGTLPPEQLESLVAPIALFPDNLLAQTLAASTYPLEIIQLQQWLEKHKDL